MEENKLNDVEKEAEAAVKQIVDKTFENVKNFSHKGRAKITERLKELEGEYDLESLLHINLAALSLTGAALGFFVDKKWFILPAASAGLLALNTLTGLLARIPLLKK